jgi:hypothetical protein
MNTARALLVAIGLIPPATPVAGLAGWRRNGSR